MFSGEHFLEAFYCLIFPYVNVNRDVSEDILNQFYSLDCGLHLVFKTPAVPLSEF